MNTKQLIFLVAAVLVANSAQAQEISVLVKPVVQTTFVAQEKQEEPPAKAVDSDEETPLKVLLVAGGCCHDYAAQTKILKAGIEERIKSEVTVVYNPDTKTSATFEIYNKDDWADNYDVVLHDECTASVTKKPYVNRILAAHKKGIPAVNIHCAMHSYRWGNFRQPVEPGAGNSGWYEMLGIQSFSHGPKAPIDVTYVQSKKEGVLTTHPTIAGMEAWTTLNEELYNNVRMFSGVEVLAMGKQIQHPNEKQLKKNPNLIAKEANAVVVWTNTYGPNKTKIFNTSLGHFNESLHGWSIIGWLIGWLIILIGQQFQQTYPRVYLY